MRKALVVGLSGTRLTADEAAFLRAERPAGIILFSRNCQAASDISRLVAAARAAIGADDVLVLIDQEGGRVQRLRPPVGRQLPPAGAFGALFETAPDSALRFAGLISRLVAEDLRALGINMNCAPVLDVPVAGAHGVIGDRAYATSADVVARLGAAVSAGFMAGGVVPVVKHVPGHGRARADSHLELPVVPTSRAELEATDFVPFARLSDAPAAMSAHVVFSAIDPVRPASTSPAVVTEVIRGSIGFDGLLMSDDLGMKALTGSIAERARAVIAAGSDLALECSGALPDMVAAAAAVPALEGRAADRFSACAAIMRSIMPFDRREAELALAEMVRPAAEGARGEPLASSPVESV